MQVVVGLGEVSQTSVFVENQNPLGDVSLVVDACIADEIGSFFVIESKMRRCRLDAFLDFVLSEGLRTEFDAEQASVEQPLAEQGQDAVFVVPP